MNDDKQIFEEKSLCEFGCGQLSNFVFKNGKHCCSKSFRQCSTYRKDHSNRMKNRVFSEEHICHLKEAWKTRESMTEETKKKIKNTLLKNPPIGEKNGMFGKDPWNKGKKIKPLTEEHRKKYQ